MLKKTLLGATALAALILLQACAPLLIGGAVIGGTLVATDRRTSGAQLEDQGIELRASSRLTQQLPEKHHINVASYNRRLLLTGEVPSEAYKTEAGKIAAEVDNVVQVYNELAVMPNSGLSDRASDTLITSRVRSALIEAKDLYAKSVTTTTERNIVYVLGRVTAREAARITEIASTTRGVQRVVNLLEIISEAELQNTLPQAPKATPAPVAVNYSNAIAPAQVPVNPPVVREVQAPAPVESRALAPVRP